MTDYGHSPDSPQPPGLPDIDDPTAVQAWVNSIEAESARITERQRLVLQAAEAEHEIFMHRTQPVPIWASRIDRFRMWTVIGAGIGLVFFAGAFSLTIDQHTSAAVLAVLPILFVLWLFLAAYEVLRSWRHYSAARSTRNQLIAEATLRREQATVRLAHFEPPAQPPRPDAT